VALSGDGRFVVFNWDGITLRTGCLARTELVNIDNAGQPLPGAGGCINSISSDGRFVSFSCVRPREPNAATSLQSTFETARSG